LTLLLAGVMYPEMSYWMRIFFPFSKLQPNVGARLRSEILLLPSSLNPLPNGVNNCDLPLANSPNCPNPKSAIFDDVQLANIDGTATKADFPARQTPVGAYSGVDSIFAGTDFQLVRFSYVFPRPCAQAHTWLHLVHTSWLTHHLHRARRNLPRWLYQGHLCPNHWTPPMTWC
jgi:hypothetical protein